MLHLSVRKSICSLICSRRKSRVPANEAIWVRARVSCASALQQRRARQRLLSRPGPQARSLLDQARLGAMTRQQVRLARDHFRELAFEGFGDTSVKRAPRLAQQRAVSGVLHESMLEEVAGLRRRACRDSKPA